MIHFSKWHSDRCQMAEFEFPKNSKSLFFEKMNSSKLIVAFDCIHMINLEVLITITEWEWPNQNEGHLRCNSLQFHDWTKMKYWQDRKHHILAFEDAVTLILSRHMFLCRNIERKDKKWVIWIIMVQSNKRYILFGRIYRNRGRTYVDVERNDLSTPTLEGKTNSEVIKTWMFNDNYIKKKNLVIQVPVYCS